MSQRSEVGRSERLPLVHEGVGAKRVPAVAGQPEQGATPEVGQLCQVLAPVDVGDIVEHGTEEVVHGHVGVEAAHHLRDLVGGVEVTGRRRSLHISQFRSPPLVVGLFLV